VNVYFANLNAFIDSAECHIVRAIPLSLKDFGKLLIVFIS